MTLMVLSRSRPNTRGTYEEYLEEQARQSSRRFRSEKKSSFYAGNESRKILKNVAMVKEK